MIIQRLKSGWNILKSVRVFIGVLVLYSSIAEQNTAGIVLGSLFTIFSLLTDGVCCMGNVCDAPVPNNKTAIPENIKYEELGSK